MPVSAIQPSYQLLEQSSKMANEAALEINARTQMPVEKASSLDFNKVEFKAPNVSDIDPLVKLNQASQYSRIGTNVLQRDQDMIGSLLDIHI